MNAPSVFIKEGMLVLHSNILPGTTVTSIRGVFLSLSQSTLSVGNAGYVPAVGLQTIQLKPLTFSTNHVGIRANTNTITMSMPNSAIVAGMVVLHPCLVAGTTVQSFRGAKLVLSQDSLPTLQADDAGYFNGSGIQTLTFSSADHDHDSAGGNKAGDGSKDDGSTHDGNNAVIGYATPSSAENISRNSSTTTTTSSDLETMMEIPVVAVVSIAVILLAFLIFVAFCCCRCCGCCAAAGAALPSKLTFAVCHLQANKIKKDILSSPKLLCTYLHNFGANVDVVLFPAEDSFYISMHKTPVFNVFCAAAQQARISIVIVSSQGALVIDKNGKRVSQNSPEVYFNVNDVSCCALVLDPQNISNQVKSARTRNVLCLFVLDRENLQEQELQTWSKRFQMYILSVQMKKLIKDVNGSPVRRAYSSIIDSNGKIQRKTSKKGKFVCFTAPAGKVTQLLSSDTDANDEESYRQNRTSTASVVVLPLNGAVVVNKNSIAATKTWKKLQIALAANRRLMQRLGKDYQSQSDTTIVLPINRPPTLLSPQVEQVEHMHGELLTTPRLGLPKKKKKKKKKKKQKEKHKDHNDIESNNDDGYLKEVKSKIKNMGHRFFQQLNKKMLKSKKTGLSTKEFAGLVRMITREQPTEQQMKTICLDVGTDNGGVVGVKILYSWCGLGIFGENKSAGKIKIVPPPPPDDDDDDDDDDHHIVVHSSSDDDEEHKVTNSAAVNNHAISLKQGKSQAEQRQIRLMKRKSRKKIEINNSESSSSSSTKTSINL